MNLLLDDHPLVILPSLAKELGNLNEAVFLQQLHYWLNRKKEEGVNSACFIEERYWVYNSLDDWLKQFVWMSKKTLQRTINSLVSKGFVIKGNFNRTKMDQTCWYTIDYDCFFAIEKAMNDLRDGQNDLLDVDTKKSPDGQNDHLDVDTKESPDGQNDHLDMDTKESSDGQNDHLDVVELGTSKKSNCPFGKSHSDSLEMVKMTKAIPYTTKEINQETTTTTSTDVDEEVLKRFIVNPQDILKAYNKRCPSFPKATQLTKERWRAMYNLYAAGYQTSDILHVFDLAEQSDFLSGRSKDAKWDRFDYDWLLQLSHFVNVLEGKYNNISPRKQKRIAENEILQNRMSDQIRAECTGNCDPNEIETPFFRDAMQRYTADSEIQEAGP